MNDKKMSNAKIIALLVSVALHAALAYYLGSMALDYALPKGEVSSIEMNFDSSKGTQTTNVDVVETAPTQIAQPVVKQPLPRVPKTLPTKEAIVEDKQGDVPVPVAVETPQVEPPQEDPIPEVVQEPIQEPTSEIEPAPEVATPVPTPAAPPAPTPTATDQGYGTPVGDSTESLVPYGSNRAHSYPYMGRLRKLEGVSIVQYTVAPSGEVVETKLLQSSGHSVLDSEAVGAIKKWKFKPMSGEVVYEKEVVFRLRGDETAAPSQLRRKTD